MERRPKDPYEAQYSPRHQRDYEPVANRCRRTTASLRLLWHGLEAPSQHRKEIPVHAVRNKARRWAWPGISHVSGIVQYLRVIARRNSRVRKQLRYVGRDIVHAPMREVRRDVIRHHSVAPSRSTSCANKNLSLEGCPAVGITCGCLTFPEHPPPLPLSTQHLCPHPTSSKFSHPACLERTRRERIDRRFRPCRKGSAFLSLLATRPSLPATVLIAKFSRISTYKKRGGRSPSFKPRPPLPSEEVSLPRYFVTSLFRLPSHGTNAPPARLHRCRGEVHA
jgi:hypothetical protein